jgi:DNA-binding NtrC family response regulator
MSEKVLIIDDEGDFLEALSERLRIRGMDVSTTTSPKEALKKIDEESYDAIILDFQMPEMDGLEALKEMKKKNPDLQVILLTGHATVERGVEALKSGALDFVEKPIDLESLAKKIKEAKAEKMLIVDKKLEERIKKIIAEKGW